MEVERKEADVGVIVARFQVSKLTAAHMDLISTVVKFHKRTVIFLGNSPVIGTRRNPLSFEAREKMLRSEFPEITVLPISDQRHDEFWSKNLDSKLSEVLQHHETAVIYGSRDSFIEHYTGKFPTQKLVPSSALSGTDARESLRVGAQASEEFRAGVIHAAYTRFPTVYPTVDIAVVKSDGRHVAMIKKVGEDKWRFPGGFVDPADKTFEDAAVREATEEIGLGEHAKPLYIGTFSVDDWRYRGEYDCIKTTFFMIRSLWGIIKAGDDAAMAEWLEIASLTEDMVVEGHRPLLRAFRGYIGVDKLGPDRFIEETP